MTDQPFSYLRSVCRDLSERMVLGRAIRNGWDAPALAEVAESFREGLFGRFGASKEAAYCQAIYIAASHPFDQSRPHCKCFWLLASAPIDLAISPPQHHRRNQPT